MKNFIFGLALGLSCVSWAVTPHADGSVTFERDEMDALRNQFYSMKAIIDQCSFRVQELQNELSKGRI